MNKINDLYTDLPDRESIFSIDIEGSITKKKYTGGFKCKIPSVKDQCFIGKHEAFLNGNLAEYLDPGILQLHKQLAYLRYTLLEYPDFWKKSDLGYDLLDQNVINEIYKKVIDFEENWLKTIWGTSDNE